MSIHKKTEETLHNYITEVKKTFLEDVTIEELSLKLYIESRCKNLFTTKIEPVYI